MERILNTMADLTHAFAVDMMRLRSAVLGDRDFDQMCRLLFDYAVCAYSGLRQSASISIFNWANRYDASGRAMIVGSRVGAPAPIAALVNGTIAHSYELDDTHDATLSHPGSVVISAALAVASERNATGLDFLRAVLAGYECMMRLGLAANAGGVIEFGFHPTAMFGAFGAATAAAALMNLPERGLLMAWGHALSLSSGSMQFSDETEGTAIKRIHAGYAAQQGVLAAEMAEIGIGAPLRAIDGKYGFLKLYGKDPKPELLRRGGAPLIVHNITFKPYACCRQFHSVIEALGEATGGFSTEGIASIVVRGPRVLADQHMIRRPTSPMAAQYSLPFVVGASLECGPTNFDAFEQVNLNRPGILKWADMLQVEHDQELQSQYPEHFGSEVEVFFAGGGSRKRRLLDSRGTPGNPFDWDNLMQKGRQLTSHLPRPLPLERLRTALAGLRGEASIYGFVDLLAVDPAFRLTTDDDRTPGVSDAVA
ncbi:MAG: MmgE/PrpD family protein [Rhizobiales bacterium]|nr:MmgE/PrpD family protein [Hyphomicrobiales bacterium]